MYNNMRYAVVLIINIILVLAGFFLLFGDPLNKQLPTKMIAIWFIVLVILDYPLRHNKIYKEIRILVYIIFLALLPMVVSDIGKSLFYSYSCSNKIAC